MNYQQALRWIYGLEGRGIKFGLSNIRKISTHFRNPQLAYPVVLVGGTNGKGSTVSFLAHILGEAGYKVGIYTSPHLITLRERIALLQGGERKYISKSKVASLASELKESIEELFPDPQSSHPTYFEVLTSLSFLYFQGEEVDIAVCEVGLGGRLDATNIAQPILSLITNIDLDHTQYLGDSPALIAKEKAGIIRERVPLVTGAEGEARKTLVRISKEKKAPIFIWNKNF